MPDLSARPLSAQGAVGSARPQTASVAAPRRAAVSRMVPPVDAVAVDGRDDAEIAVFVLHTSRQWVGAFRARLAGGRLSGCYNL